MQWKKYLQFNPLGTGEAYAWAYDEAVCSVSSNDRGTQDYPWCTFLDPSKEAVDSGGNVIDYNCPCTVHNSIAPLSALPFKEEGWGHHMLIHIYDIMYPGYIPPTKPVNFSPIKLNHVAFEDSEFYMKVVNQY